MVPASKNFIYIDNCLNFKHFPQIITYNFMMCVHKISYEIQKLKWNLFLAFTLGYFTTFGVALLHTTLYVNDCRNAP